MSEVDIEWRIAEQPLDVTHMLGYLPSEGVPSLDEQERLAHEARAPAPPGPAYPGSCDLRDHNGKDFITPVRDQGQCGSCVAFGSCAAVEGTLRFEKNDPSLDVDLSEAYLYYCVAAGQGRTCGPPNAGWYPKAALEAIKSGGGVPDEGCFPYTPGDQPCDACSDWRARATTIAGWQPLNDAAEIKEWISSRGPAVASMKVYEDFQHYAEGVYSYVTGQAMGGHCICVVGYDDPGGFWIAKNSWGTGWGEGGFFRIAYGQCAIDSGMLGVEGIDWSTAARRNLASQVATASRP